MPMFKRRSTDTPCDATNCTAHAQVEQVLGDFTSIAEKLSDGQLQMQLSIARLGENIKGIKSISEDLGKLEDKVDKNSQLLWKVVGGVSVVALVAPVIISKFL